MANSRYPKLMEHLAKGQIDYDTAAIRAYLVETDTSGGAGTFDAYSDSDDVIANIAAGARSSSAAVGTATSLTNGLIDVANFTFATVAAIGGRDYNAVVFTVTGTDGTTEYLMQWVDTDASGNPIAITPDGRDIDVTISLTGLLQL